MSIDNDLCDYCGEYIDPIGGDNAIGYHNLLWCCAEHLKAWVAENEKAGEELDW